MNCMKCGRKVEENQVFCDLCREDMEKYPVKPDIAVMLPSAQDKAKKPPRRPTISQDEQIAILKRKNRRLIRWLAASFVLVALLGLCSGYLAERVGMQKVIGQNYSTIASAENS